MRPKRSLAREIGNPISMFHGSGPVRTRKWSMFHVLLFGLWVAFLTHFPSAWGPWEWATLATLALAKPIADLFAMAPISEGLAALAAIFGATVSKRMSTSSTSSTTETTVEGPTKLEVTGASDIAMGEGPPHEWADGVPDEGDA